VVERGARVDPAFFASRSPEKKLRDALASKPGLKARYVIRSLHREYHEAQQSSGCSPDAGSPRG